MGILKSVFRVQGPEERECRRESESLGPAEALRHPVIGLVPLTNRNVIHFFLFVKSFVKNNFCVCFFAFNNSFFSKILGKATCCKNRLIFIKFF